VENREVVLVAPNAASLLDGVQACSALSIRKWVDTVRTWNILRGQGTDDAAHGAATHY